MTATKTLFTAPVFLAHALMLLGGGHLVAEPRGEAAIEAMVAQMIDVESRLIEKLAAQEKTINSSFKTMIDGASDKAVAIALERTADAQSELLLTLWRQADVPNLQEAILTKASGLHIAFNDLVAAEINHLRVLDAARRGALANTINTLKRSRAEHKKLLKYLQDDSLSRKLGELDVSAIGLSFAETVKVVESFRAAEKSSEEEIEKRKKAVEDALRSIQRLSKSAHDLKGGGAPADPAA